MSFTRFTCNEHSSLASGNCELCSSAREIAAAVRLAEACDAHDQADWEWRCANDAEADAAFAAVRRARDNVGVALTAYRAAKEGR